MMYLATCSSRIVASQKFLGCHAGRLSCPTHVVASLGSRRICGCVDPRSRRLSFFSQLALSRSGRSREEGGLMQLARRSAGGLVLEIGRDVVGR